MTNARDLAQETSAWYLEHHDPHAPHTKNVHTYLRGKVLALTLRILVLDVDLHAPRQLELELEHEHEQHQHQETQEVTHTEASLDRHARARMEGFLAGCALAVPNEFDEVPGERPSISHHSSSTNASTLGHKDASIDAGLSGFQTNGTRSQQPFARMTNSNAHPFPQFRLCELTTRLELYIRSLFLVQSTGKNVVLDMESPRSIKARANTLVRSFVATVGCVRGMRPCLTLLIQCLTREILAVECICNDISNVMRRLVSEYEHQTSFASLAFLSSPEDSARNRLTPLLISYLQYLQVNWEIIVEGCEIEHMLTTVLQPEMRNVFKTIEFKSIGHLLEVCQGFQKELQAIELPPNMGGMAGGADIDTVCSDSKSIQQAIRDLQREIITVNGHVLPPANSRKHLLQLLSQMLNSRSLFMTKKHKSRRSGLTRHNASCPALLPTQTNQQNELDSKGFISSGNEGDTDDQTTATRGSQEQVSQHRVRRRSFHVSTVNLMTRRLLIAASRTGMGGDAYFVVRDLFGGDEVEVVSSNAPRTSYGKPGTIEIVVRLASVTIKCNGTLDVFPKSRIGECEPLIQLHTTTTETINLQEVRASSDDIDSSEEYESGSKMVLQEKKNDRTGWRTLSIRPALYEAVEKWTTPS